MNGGLLLFGLLQVLDIVKSTLRTLLQMLLASVPIYFTFDLQVFTHHLIVLWPSSSPSGPHCECCKCTRFTFNNKSSKVAWIPGKSPSNSSRQDTYM